ncbi:MAG: hypothetical protein AAF709_24090 [Pseudomonadota bacterium]
MSDVTDTMLNLTVFVFIGIAIWLALKPASGLEERQERAEGD